MLKLTQQEFEGVPILVKAEVLVAAVACMWGTWRTVIVSPVTRIWSRKPPFPVQKITVHAVSALFHVALHELQAACKFPATSSH